MEGGDGESGGWGVVIDLVSGLVSYVVFRVG